MRTGEIISRINDAVKIRAFINNTIIDLIVNVLIVLFAFALMFIYYWKLALIMLLVIPLYFTVYIITNYLNKRTQRKVMEHAADLESQLVESVNSAFTIKSFGLESVANLKTETRFVKLLQSVYTSGINGIFSSNASFFISRIFTVVLLWVGSVYVIEQQITPGELLSFYALIGYFTGPVNGLIGANRTIQDALIASDRLFELMDLEQEDKDDQIKLDKELLGDIHFEHVHFRYGSRVTVFEDLSLKFPKGKVSAIVGESGSGKSSLMAILQKLYPVESGNIMIGDYNLKYIESNSLRALIGVVPQKIDLFAGNVIENIAVGEFAPDMERLMKICLQLDMMKFIEKLPNGYNTYLGENGASLSGGQKQRIAIARALYKEPEILILDEATSSLDSASEKYVQRAISMLSQKGKTVIVIAHRLSTIKDADRIFVLHEGKLVEEGDHKELLENQNQYSFLWRQQHQIEGEVEMKEVFS